MCYYLISPHLGVLDAGIDVIKPSSKGSFLHRGSFCCKSVNTNDSWIWWKLNVETNRADSIFVDKSQGAEKIQLLMLPLANLLTAYCAKVDVGLVIDYIEMSLSVCPLQSFWAHTSTPKPPHAHPYTHIHTHTHKHTHIHTHTLPYTPIHTNTHPHTHAHTPIHTHPYTHTPVHTCTCTHIHTHTHTHPYIQSHIYEYMGNETKECK